RQTWTATQDLETSAKRCVGHGATDPMFSEPSSKPNAGRHWISPARPYGIVPYPALNPILLRSGDDRAVGGAADLN
ncbi:hypothetical protein PO002_45785, partial [Cupriavidus necator]|uniref:hypothetical protein n=1 Tax=Cupriavidus necator TaxID=106590 RepID=UPI0039C10431